MRGQMTHLDTDVLAEFRAGLITGRRGARITAHLGGCERCTALDEQLVGVRSLLASVPAPAMRHGERRYKGIRPNGPVVTAYANPPRPGGRAVTAASGCWHCECSRLRPPSSCWARASTG